MYVNSIESSSQNILFSPVICLLASIFEKEFHKVDLGNEFLMNKSGREMTLYLSNSLFWDNVVNPLNNQRWLYFSFLYDSSSSSKVNDEKSFT